MDDPRDCDKSFDESDGSHHVTVAPSTTFLEVVRRGAGLFLMLLTVAGILMGILPWFLDRDADSLYFWVGAGIGIGVTGLAGLIAYVPAKVSGETLDGQVETLRDLLTTANKQLEAIPENQRLLAQAGLDAQLRTAFISTSDHRGGSFVGLRLSGETLSQSELTNVKMSNLYWDQVIVDGGMWTNIETANATFRGCGLTNLAIRGDRTWINNSTFTQTVFTAVRVEPVSGQKAGPKLPFVRVEGGLLSNVWFEAEMHGVHFVPGPLEPTDAGDAALGPEFEGVTLRNCNLTEARFERAILVNGSTSFENCTFELAHLLELKCGPQVLFHRCVFGDTTITSRPVIDPAAAVRDRLSESLPVRFVECLFGSCDLTGWARESEYRDCHDADSKWPDGKKPSGVEQFVALTDQQRIDVLHRVGQTSEPSKGVTT